MSNAVLAQPIENDFSASSINIAEVYKELFLQNYRYFVLSSGRCAGKTTAIVYLWWITMNLFPDRDIVILQSTATEIKDSIINEIRKFVNNSNLESEFIIPESRAKINRVGYKSTTWIYPITDSKGGQRSRGITTTNPISLVLYEEAQKNKDANVLEQSVVTFIRQLDKDAKMVIVGNNETVGHWFVDYVEEKKQNKEWLYIYATCNDIWGFLNEQTKSYILGVKESNPMEYERIFMGNIYADTSEVVFPQFKKELHYKRRTEMQNKIITHIIFGVDHATTNDTFACVPVAIMDDGTCVILEVFFNDPKLTNIALAGVEQCTLLEDFFLYMDKQYGIAYNQLRCTISIDSAASTFIQDLKHAKKVSKHRELWRQLDIRKFSLKKKDTNLRVLKNALAYNVVTILNEGVGTWEGTANTHRLINEIQKQRYKNNKLDASIPNDLVDAWEYGMVTYYANCFNLSFPRRTLKDTAHYNDIRRIAKL